MIDISGGTRVSRNDNLETVEGEVIIDLFTDKLGAYCGSFAIQEKYAMRGIVAINAAGNLLIEGKTGTLGLYATIRQKRGKC